MQDLAALLLAKPRLGIGNGCIDHRAIDCLHGCIEGLDFRIGLVVVEGEVDTILVLATALRLEDTETEGDAH